jgi:hypothetical protein
MTRKTRNVLLTSAAASSRNRRLRFDILEQRRLLAGIDVYLFNDLNASRTFDPLLDEVMSDKAVYADLNRDGQLNATEPWTVSDANGIAHFADLTPGTYSIRLLGNSNSAVQSFPTKPADSGAWGDDVGTVVRVDSTGNFWSYSNGSLTLREVGSLLKLKSIEFSGATILDAAIPQEGSVGTSYVLTRELNQTKILWEVSTDGMGSKKPLDIDASDVRSLVSMGDKLLVSSGKGLQELSVLNGDAVKVMTKIGISGIDANAQIQNIDNYRFAVVENGADSSRMTVYSLGDSVAKIEGKRTFAFPISTWDVSNNGRIAISTNEGVKVLLLASGLPTVAELADSAGPVLFDAGRSRLLTGSVSTTQLLAWKIDSWNVADAIPLAVGGSLMGGSNSLHLDRFGRYLVGIGNNRTYQHDLATAIATNVVVAAAGVTQIQIGLRLNKTNQAPVLNDLAGVSLDEDQSIPIGLAGLASKASDADGDSLVYLLKNQPKLGSIAWNQSVGGTYVPTLNANGQDSLVVQAYDGLAWSAPRTLTISIRPVNDPPVSIDSSVNKVTENPTLQSLLGMLQVQDPDADADYMFQVADPRFSVVGGAVKLVSGNINFEKEPSLVLPIIAIDRKHPSDSLSRTLTWSVLDQNDAPTGIVSSSSYSVPELSEGIELGSVGVVDEDVNGTYDWTVSDGRFQVVDGKLKLSPGTALDFETQSTIGVTLRAMDAGKFVEKSITISVTDQNDVPTDLVLTGSGTVGENRPGVSFGNVSVIDPDQGEIYSVSVNDTRFEVVKGVAKLKAGVSLSYVEPGFIDLLFTATSQSNGTQIKKTGRLHVVKDTTPYHNDANPLDVDGDGSLTPLDPLIVINYINKRGVGPVVDTGEGEGTIPDIDVDGDGEVTPLDILILINRLNRGDRGTGEGSGSNGGLGGGLPEGEGEAPTAPMQVATWQIIPTPESTPASPSEPIKAKKPIDVLPNLRHRDASFASYRFDLSEEFGPRRRRS